MSGVDTSYRLLTRSPAQCQSESHLSPDLVIDTAIGSTLGRTKKTGKQLHITGIKGHQRSLSPQAGR